MPVNILVSIIVPTYQSALYLEATLKAIVEQSYPLIELLVIDNNSKDNTLEIARKYTKHVYDQGPERSAQRNYGVLKSSGQYVLILDSDMVLSKKVIESSVKLLEQNPTLQALVLPEESFGIGFWAHCKSLERSFYIGVDWMEAARMFRRSTFLTEGGYDEVVTGTEDYDFPQRIEEKYGREAIGRTCALIYHNEQRLSLIKTCKKKFYYAQSIDVYKSKKANISKFNNQANPIKRYLLFFSSPIKLFKNPILGLGMLFMKTCEFGSGALGYFWFKFTGRYVDARLRK